MSNHQLSCTQLDHQKMYLAYAESGRHFFPNSMAQNIFQLWIYEQVITTSHWMSHQYQKKNSLHFTIWEI